MTSSTKKKIVELVKIMSEALTGEESINIDVDKEIKKGLNKPDTITRDLKKIDPDLAKRKSNADKLLKQLRRGGKILVKGAKFLSPSVLAEPFARETLRQSCSLGDALSCEVLKDFFDERPLCPI